MTIIPSILIAAMIQVESGGNDQAIGDNGRAFGCLQISDCVIADVRRITGMWLSHTDAFNRTKAVRICLVYINHYATEERLGHEPTLEDMARIWNSGPRGWAKPCSLPYWEKVKRELEILQSRLPVGSEPYNAARGEAAQRVAHIPKAAQPG